MKVLALDVSSHLGWALLEGELGNMPNLLDYGEIHCQVEDFNVNKEPNKSPLYPKNIWDASEKLKFEIITLIDGHELDFLIVENTVKGRNRHTQRMLEWQNKALFDLFLKGNYKYVYLDPSEWRSILKIKLSKEQKKNNSMVSKKLKKGRIGKKHLSVAWVNSTFGLKLKLKANNAADAICLGTAYFVRG